jgi:two-component system sensor histidine kinase BaeS
MKRVSITTRLVVSSGLIIIVTLLAFIAVANRVVSDRFADLIMRNGTNLSKRMVPILEDYYLENGSWDGVGGLFLTGSEMRESGFGRNRHDRQKGQQMPNFMLANANERFLLVEDSKIIFDSDPSAAPIEDTTGISKVGTPIVVGEKEVGVLLSASSLGILSENQSHFINKVSRTLIQVAIVAIIILILVIIWQAQMIVKPLKETALAAGKISKGDYNQRVKVSRNDEVGDLANAFNKMAADLSQQSELRKQTMADVAHELRTPLSILRIDLESMEDGLIEPTSENINHLKSEVAYLSHLVEDLRMLSLVDAGDLKIEKSAIEVNNLVQEVVERHQNAAREKEICLKIVSEGRDLFAMVDEQRISQVLVNLLANAIQHTPPGKEIIVKTSREDRKIRVSVTNFGTSISQSDLEKVFERFYRLERSRNRDKGGSGLGLAIARSIVRAHGGEISAQSQEGISTTFSFWLPCLNQSRPLHH